MHRLTYLLLCFFVAACGTVAPGPTPQPTATPVDPALIEQGIQVYRQNYCGSCHILDAANTRGNFGPQHNDAGLAAQAHLTLDTYAGEATTAAEYIRESIVAPGAFYTPGYEATNHHMPAFAHLDDDDINAMVQMLLVQRGGS